MVPQFKSLYGSRWWDAPKEQVAAAVAAWAATLEMEDAARRQANLIYARLSTNRDLPNIYGLSLARTAGKPWNTSGWRAPVFNVIGSSVETLVNKVGRNKPWVLFLTDGGDFYARMTGKKYSRFVDGVFHATDTYRLTRQAFTDAVTYGDGIIKVTPSLDGKSIVHDVILPDELLVDQWDAIYFGKWPRSIIHRTFVSKTELLSVYGDDDEIARAIETAPGAHAGPSWVPSLIDNHSSMVAVLDAFKLPEPDGSPGRHVFCISDRVTLVDEDYTRKRHPFAKLGCISAGRGFWNIGIPEVLLPFQVNINKTQAVIEECQARMSTGRWLVPTDSGVTDDALGSKPGGIIRHHVNRAPQFIAPQAVPAELYKHLEETISRAYKRAGISELAAQALKPGGLNSGEALRAFQSAESERYVTLGMQLEDFVVDIAKLDLELAQEIRPTVFAPRPGRVDVIDWSDLKGLKPDGAIMKAFPISSLPTSPAGRLQRAAEMFQTGQISREDYLRLIDYPDTESVIEINTASRDTIDWMLDRMIEDGIYEPPEPYQNLQESIRVAQNRYLRERTRGCPEERLELLRRFMDQCEALLTRPPANGNGGQQGGGQQGAGAASGGGGGPVPMNQAQAAAGGLPPPVPPVIGPVTGSANPALPSYIPPPVSNAA